MTWSATNRLAHRLSIWEKSIIQTLAYYESLGQLPLSLVELYRYLQKNPPERPTLIQVLKALKNLSSQGLICQEKGLFFLKNGAISYQQRICQQKISIKKWKKLKKITPYLNLVPYLRGLMASGSLVLENAKPESDIDLLVITKRGRIWTCRLLLSFFLEIIGQRRSPKHIKDRICLNHYLAEPWFEIKLQNLSNAQLYAHLIPLINYQAYQNFHQRNKWLQDFLYSNFFDRQTHQKRINQKKLKNRFYRRLAKFFECSLDNKFGDWLEKKLANWQIARIERKTSDKKLAKNQLYLSDKALLFHYPICRNAQVEKSYFEKIKQLGVCG